jgi:hypothetical protein
LSMLALRAENIHRSSARKTVQAATKGNDLLLREHAVHLVGTASCRCSAEARARGCGAGLWRGRGAAQENATEHKQFSCQG